MFGNFTKRTGGCFARSLQRPFWLLPAAVVIGVDQVEECEKPVKRRHSSLSALKEKLKRRMPSVTRSVLRRPFASSVSVVKAEGEIEERKKGPLLSGRPLRIAVIGAGISGSACSHFLCESLTKQLFDECSQPFEIDLFESGHSIGGRVQTGHLPPIESKDSVLAYPKGLPVEEGAGIVIDENKYMFDFTDLLGLEREYRSTGRVAFFNGRLGRIDDNFLGKGFWDVLSMLWTYGFISFWRLTRVAHGFIDGFGKIYPLQAKGQAFDNVMDLYGAMGIAGQFEGNGLEWIMQALGEHSYSPIVAQLVTGFARANYGQNPENMTPLSMMTSVAPLASGKVWHVKSGNQRIAEKLVEMHPEINCRFGTRVTALSKEAVATETEGITLDTATDGAFIVQYTDESTAAPVCERYDLVILATPLSLTKIDFDEDSFGQRTHEVVDFFSKQEFQTTYVYWLKGQLNGQWLGADALELSKITSVLHSNTGGKALGDASRFCKLNSWQIPDSDTAKPGDIPEHWQAMQTWKPLLKEDLEQMFLWYDAESVREFEWKAYPNYQWLIDNWQTIEDCQRKRNLLTFVLDPSGLYYVNGIEAGTSAQEVVVVGAKNVSNLICKQLAAAL